MKYWKQLVRFTLWYFVGTGVTWAADYIIFGSVASDEVSIDAEQLFAFIFAATLALRSSSILRAGLSKDGARSLPAYLAVWTFFSPVVVAILGLLLLFVTGQPVIDELTALLTSWSQASSATVIGVLLSQVLNAVAVYWISRRLLDLYFSRKQETI